MAVIVEACGAFGVNVSEEKTGALSMVGPNPSVETITAIEAAAGQKCVPTSMFTYRRTVMSDVALDVEVKDVNPPN